jgi:hypothetical protein
MDPELSEPFFIDSPLPPSKRPRSTPENEAISDCEDAVVPESKPSIETVKPKTMLERFLSYAMSEFTSDDLISTFNPQLNSRIQNFLKVPKECERFLWYGFLACLDSFLYVFSILPVRYDIKP